MSVAQAHDFVLSTARPFPSSAGTASKLADMRISASRSTRTSRTHRSPIQTPLCWTPLSASVCRPRPACAPTPPHAATRCCRARISCSTSRQPAPKSLLPHPARGTASSLRAWSAKSLPISHLTAAASFRLALFPSMPCGGIWMEQPSSQSHRRPAPQDIRRRREGSRDTLVA